jgi:hypothetical protein
MNDYFEALERLKNGTPKIVDVGSKINNDTVALEAGRKRGSIKKGRDTFSLLIEAIENCNNEENTYKFKYEKIKEKRKKDIEKYKILYEDALNRELMLIDRLNTLEKSLKHNNKLYFARGEHI